MVVKKEHKTERHVNTNVSSTSSSKMNYWMTATVLLAIILLVVWASGSFSGISKSAAQQKVISLAATSGLTLNVTSVTEKSGLYMINYSIQGQSGQIMLTKDGNFIGQMGAYPVKTASSASTDSNSQQNTQTTVPKSAKPTADLYVFTYCPYGTQVEKGFVPVYNLLKNKADLNIVFIGAMHGPFEEKESLRQLCIQKIYGKDKLMSYILNFDTSSAVGACQGTDSCVDPLIAKIYSNLSMNANTINTCMTKDAPALYAADVAKAQANGVSGSPTMIINGVQTQTGRSPAALLQAVCSAFTTAPAECSQTLDSATPSAGFGATAGSSTGASCAA